MQLFCNLAFAPASPSFAHTFTSPASKTSRTHARPSIGMKEPPCFCSRRCPPFPLPCQKTHAGSLPCARETVCTQFFYYISFGFFYCSTSPANAFLFPSKIFHPSNVCSPPQPHAQRGLDTTVCAFILSPLTAGSTAIYIYTYIYICMYIYIYTYRTFSLPHAQPAVRGTAPCPLLLGTRVCQLHCFVCPLS
jgi:hypothetical protein